LTFRYRRARSSSSPLTAAGMHSGPGTCRPGKRSLGSEGIEHSRRPPDGGASEAPSRVHTKGSSTRGSATFLSAAIEASAGERSGSPTKWKQPHSSFQRRAMRGWRARAACFETDERSTPCAMLGDRVDVSRAKRRRRGIAGHAGAAPSVRSAGRARSQWPGGWRTRSTTPWVVVVLTELASAHLACSAGPSSIDPRAVDEARGRTKRGARTSPAARRLSREETTRLVVAAIVHHRHRLTRQNHGNGTPQVAPHDQLRRVACGGRPTRRASWQSWCDLAS